MEITTDALQLRTDARQTLRVAQGNRTWNWAELGLSHDREEHAKAKGTLVLHPAEKAASSQFIRLRRKVYEPTAYLPGGSVAP